MAFHYPKTPRTPIKKTVGGVSFEDPYPWLHDDTPEALVWQTENNQLAHQICTTWPGYEKLLAAIELEITDLEETKTSVPLKVGGRWFRLSHGPDGKSSALYTSDTCYETGRLLVDSAELSRQRQDGRSEVLVFFKPSFNGRLVSFLSLVGGDPQGILRVVDSETGHLLSLQAEFPRHIGPAWCWEETNKALLAPGWMKDGHHCIRRIPISSGEAEEILKVFWPAEVPLDIPAIFLSPSRTARWLLAVTSPWEHQALIIGDLENNTWQPFLPERFEGECHGAWLDDDTYIAIVTHQASRGRVVAIPVRSSRDPSTWRELIPESEAILRSLDLVQGRIVVVALKDVRLQIKIHALDGCIENTLPLPFFGSSHLLTPPRFFPHSEEFLFDYGGFTTHESTYRYDFMSRQLEFISKSERELTNIEVTQRFAVSKDGTRVPYFMVHRKDLDLARQQPTLVYGYGGYGATLLPSYLAHLVPFVQAGGIFVQASLRGGGEYGKEWHEAGRLHHKQNTFDDLFAVAEDLIRSGISRPEKLAMQGASNGGMLAGVAITQRPDLWRVVVPLVPFLDLMEPVNASGSGAPGLPYMVEDYGRLDDPQSAQDIFQYSPYHNIHPRVAYPAVCVVGGDKDLACVSFHGRRFVAALRAANTSNLPILHRVWKDASHGALGRTYTEQCAEWLAFIMQQLEMVIE